MKNSTKQLFSFDTIQTADCIEWCPINENENENENEKKNQKIKNNLNSYVCCATYQLIEGEKPKRIGKLYLFQEEENKEKKQTEKTLNLIKSETKDTNAIFDIKWSHKSLKIEKNGKKQKEAPILCQASADGSLLFYSLRKEKIEKIEKNEKKEEEKIILKQEKHLTFFPLKTINENNPKIEPSEPQNKQMCLSLDWSNRVTNNFENGYNNDNDNDNNNDNDNDNDNNNNNNKNKEKIQIVSSFSNGKLSLSQFTNNNSQLKLLKTWKAHDYEAWICGFDYHDPNIIYSGGDDCKFKCWDQRVSFDFPIFCPKHCHSAGVCSIHSHPFNDHLLCTGSYDETICLWDTRSLKRPIVTTDKLGGGVWRLKWNPNKNNQYKNQILAACMHNGFKIINFDEKKQGYSIFCEYNNHKSLAYGCDWSYSHIFNEEKEKKKEKVEEEGKQKNNDYYICSCSFYDHSLQYWKTCLK